MLHLINHPIIEIKLNILRDKRTEHNQFRIILDEISSLMTYEVLRDVKIHTEGVITTPTNCTIDKLKFDNNIIIVPILRAGIGMSNGVAKMMPNAKIGHIGLYRDETTLQPVEYFFKMPKVNNPLVVLCDPMLATGGSASAAITLLKKRGYTNIRLMALVGVDEGIKKVTKDHPDVDIYLASKDEKLNEKGYILPGLGDAGDRIFGTL